MSYLSAPEVLLNTHKQPGNAPYVQKKPKKRHTNALVIGYSNHGRLPHAVLEAQQAATHIGRRMPTTMMLEAEATLERLQASSQTVQLLHIATHAVYRQDNPLFSWMSLADSKLTVADLCTMTLPQHPLVVLSACETGRGQARGGGLLGMGRGFLAAGASGLIVGLWKIDDQAAAQLMVDFYAPHTSYDPWQHPAATLAMAQRKALQQYQHPSYWAGFIFIKG